MSKYAIIQLAGKQYKVIEGDTLTVNKLEVEEGKKLTISDVLLSVNDKNIEIGSPLVKGSSVVLETLKQQKGEKIRVATYKAKSRYRRVKGHRQQETVLKVVKIGS